MRSFRTLTALAAMLLAPGAAAAQPTAYICTPTGQVLTVNGTTGTTAVIYTGSGGFDDCVVGPDGWLYVSNDFNILRLDPASPSSVEFVTSPSLPSKAMGLAFNVATLYVNTASSGVWRLDGISEDHSAPYAAPVQAFALGSAGRGITFDIEGRMILASGADLRSSSPFYSTSAPLVAAAGYPIGVAINTCREVVFADKNTKTIRRRSVGGVVSAIGGLTFPYPHIPLYLEIDASNRMFIVTAKDTAGSYAKVWRAEPAGSNPLTSCATYNAPTLLKDLGTLYSSYTMPSLLSAKAVGVAIDPTSHTLTHTFTASAAACTKEFDFGYHTFSLTFDGACPALTVSTAAHRSRPADVVFASSPFAPSTHGLRYSPLGGFVLQYVLTASAPPPPFRAKYSFFSQETIGKPGVARSPIDALTATFTEDVGSDFWDVGVLDAAGGERGNDFSKRVVYNSNLAAAAGTCVAGPFEEPLNSGNPLFKSGQNLKVAFKVPGAACANGTLRVSVVRIVGSGFEVMPVKSKAASEIDNIMSFSGTKYSFNLDLKGYPIGTYQITVWGTVVAPINKIFKITK